MFLEGLPFKATPLLLNGLNLFKKWVMFGSTFGMAGAFFLIGAAVAGLQSAMSGGGFWEEVGSYITNNWSETLVITSITYILFRVGYFLYNELDARGKILYN